MVTSALQLIKGTVSACYFEKISKIYFAFLAKQLAAPEIQSALQESISDSYARLAISLLMIDQGLGGVRPYLTVHDELQSKGYSEASLDFLYKIQKIDPWHPLVISRLINRLYISKDFSEMISLLDYLPSNRKEEVLKINGTREIVIDVCKFLLCDTLLFKLGGFSEEIEWIFKQKTEMMQYSLQDISLLVSSENYDAAQRLISYFYSSGMRSEEFFNKAVPLMKNEHDISLRVLFFRIEAEKHCTNANTSELAIRSYLAIGEVEKAFLVIKRAIVRRCYSEQIIYYLTRVMTLLGKPLDDLLLAGFFGMPDYARVSAFINKSALNLSVNNGRFIQSEFIKNGLYNRQSEFCSKPVFSPIIPRPYNRGHVAICLSGQIRGLEENYKNILRIKDSIKNCDIFIDTWSKGRLTPPRFNRVARFLGDDLFSYLPEVAKIPSEFIQLFPETANKITQPVEVEINNSYLNKYFPNALVNVEDESIFEKLMEEKYRGMRCQGTFNQAKMFYKIHHANELVKNSAKYNDYDIVIRCRPDLNIVIDDLNSYIEEITQDRNLIYTSYINAVGYGDQFAIGSKDAMDIYSSLWTKALAVNRLSYSNLFDEKANLAGEALLANHLIFNGVSVKLLKPKRYRFENPLAINVVDIEDALIRDISQNGLHEEMKAFMSHFNACRANNVRFK